ncbi:hypothetical protein IV203_016234 [Nitzschia inconspicua]|uniref:COP9 signalosome complex subunit 3 N-terminal helical repeats domain-containing protein n=1 Tax=Nitzschia inconspicua TaxID=303405 RepID=A0A9K3KQS3_9STRA|nr:hypothetical protein IV203_017449 [Nitzschia inconspicua]KAG7347529.1 hypothetical protein IV203_016234 [Nitzschia inconspicua]
MDQAGGTATSSLMLPPAFVEDPAGYLTSVASRQPSRQGIGMISGAIAKWFVAAAPKSVMGTTPSSNGDGTANAAPHPAAQFAAHYLRAAAVHLQSSTQATVGNVEQETLKKKCQFEVLEAVGAAATLCTNRTAISSSGILPTLEQMMVQGQFDADAASPFVLDVASSRPGLSSKGGPFSSSSSFYPPLQQAGVEFLQCAILSEQYRYAARSVEGTWPRPTSGVTIKTVLRYYYLRGIVHLGCGDYTMAHRCWWTCLSVPADACSAIMVAAWKKLSLVQPLLDRYRGASNVFQKKSSTSADATRFPRSMSKAVGRMLTTARENRDEAVLLYSQLGPATEKGNMELVKTLIETHSTILKSDGNYGLAQECLKRVQQNLVWEASQLFSVVSVTQLAQRWKISPDHVPQRLIGSLVPCQLEDDGMVVFGIGGSTGIGTNQGGIPEAISQPHTDTCWTDLSQWMQLSERLQHLDASISTSTRYHALTRKEKKGGADSGETSVLGLLPRGVQDL